MSFGSFANNQHFKWRNKTEQPETPKCNYKGKTMWNCNFDQKNPYQKSSAATSGKSYTAIVISSVVSWVCSQIKLPSGFGLCGGAHKLYQIRAMASICTLSKNSPTQQLSLALIEIPGDVQPGRLSCSHCGRWIGAHQWLLEVIREAQTVPQHWCSWMCVSTRA